MAFPLMPFALGLVSAPLVRKIAKNTLRSTVKGTVGAALVVRKLAAEAREEVQGLAADAYAEVSAAEVRKRYGETVPGAAAATPKSD